jgi:hypothetical protein
MLNSAALWPLLEPQWSAPRRWWIELSRARGRKDYDWSHTARRYWPGRVDEKCQIDASLSIAHGCFWWYHPQRAWARELQLQDALGADFRIQEPAYTHPDGTISPDHVTLRRRYLAAHPHEALQTVEREALRRMGRGRERTRIDGIRLLDSGIWSALPDAVQTLEDTLSQRQEHPFRLQAPDRPDGRRR